MEEKNFKEKRKEIFLELLAQEWNGKKIWEHIRDKDLTATPAFEGSLYNESSKKIMFVGRALNGWDYELGNSSNLNDIADSLLGQTSAFETFVDERGFGDGSRKYKHKNSKFFRFIKHILEDVGESDSGVDETWYNDTKSWNQRFVWANLYCISPRNPKPGTDANPNNKMIKLGINSYVDLMKLYIEYYKPDVVIFITDVEGWFIRWKREKSFKDILGSYEECNIKKTIVAKGMLNDSKIIVCKRPDRWGMTYKEVESMANVISENI